MKMIKFVPSVLFVMSLVGCASMDPNSRQVIETARAPASVGFPIQTISGSSVQVSQAALIEAMTQSNDKLVHSDPPTQNGDKSFQFNNPSVFYKGAWHFITRRDANDGTLSGACDLFMKTTSAPGLIEVAKLKEPKPAVVLGADGVVHGEVALASDHVKGFSCKPFNL